jgi:Ulp1 family protease
MLWNSRGMVNVQEPDVHFFTSHFFLNLSRHRPEAVTSWTAKNNIDIFKKKLISIPSNETMHWLLCVVVNHGEIEDYVVGTQPNEDLLKMHNPKVAKSYIQK